MLTEKDAQRVVGTWMRDNPASDGTVWVWSRRWSWKGLLQIPIWWGGGDRRMGDQPREDGFGGKGLLFRRIGVWIPSSLVLPFSFEFSQCYDDIYTNLMLGPSWNKCMFETWKYERLCGGSWTDINLENIDFFV